MSEHSMPTNPRFKDLTGQVFGRVIVGDYVGKSGKHPLWSCRCECGGEAVVRSTDLVTGNTESCGCLQRERSHQASVTHGQSCGKNLTREYVLWKGIIQRCTNPKNNRYHCYGGRGIRICERWRRSFEDFLVDVGERPSPEHSIDRIENDGNYEPGNVRWATRRQQQQNRTNNRFITFDGQTHCLTEWARRVGINNKVLHSRLGRGWSVERALTTKVQNANVSVQD